MASSNSSLDERLTKRSRTEDCGDSQEVKRGVPYYNDGNIILDVDGTHFRVYKGILAASSTIFADMFSIPQPESGGQLVSECPIVKMMDSTEDWQYVLEALFERK